MIDLLHFIVAHVLIFGMCAAIIILDPIREQGRAGDVYPKRQVQTAYRVNVPQLD